MKRVINICFIVILCVLAFCPPPAMAWGNSGEPRPSYTVEEINEGVLGPLSPDEDGYPGKIVFNSISNSVDGDEFNFVSARVYHQNRQEDSPIWNGNEIQVEEGKEYTIRMYVHNNNPNGEDAVAKDVHVAISVPTEISYKIQVNGFITSSNSEYNKYWDYVNFVSDRPFSLAYESGSAQYYNNAIGKDGYPLSDDVVSMARSGGTLIGYDALDGRIPGWYQYDSYVTIRVKPIFDYKFESAVRVKNGTEKEWNQEIEAEVGDRVEFRITYQELRTGVYLKVVLKNSLPDGLSYIDDTLRMEVGKEKRLIENSKERNKFFDMDVLTEGISFGDYFHFEETEEERKVNVYFTAEVTGENLSDGDNLLVNWTTFHTNNTTLQTHVKVNVFQVEKIKILSLCSILLCLLCSSYWWLFKRKHM